MNKFTVIPVSKRKTYELVIERRRIEYKEGQDTRILFQKIRIPKRNRRPSQHASNQIEKVQSCKC